MAGKFGDEQLMQGKGNKQAMCACLLLNNILFMAQSDA
jgi:hypothetical protein